MTAQKHSFKDAPPIEAQARALRDALRRLMVAAGALDETRRPCGTPLSMPHAHALLELLTAHSDSAALTVTALADRLSIDRTNVSRLVARMEAAGELERVPDPHDARARALRLTPHGEHLAQHVDASSADHFQHVFNSLASSDADEIVTTLQHLSDALLSQRGRAASPTSISAQ